MPAKPIKTPKGKKAGVYRGDLSRPDRRIEDMPKPLPDPVRASRRKVVSEAVEPQALDAACRLVAMLFRRYGGRGLDIPTLPDRWEMEISQFIGALTVERVNIGAYVRYACTSYREATGNAPWPEHVFTKRALARWLPRYREDGRQFLTPTTYQPTAERLRQYEENLRRGRRGQTEEPVPMDAGLRAGNAPPADSGPDPAAEGGRPPRS